MIETISQAAEYLIITQEVSGKDTYIKRYQKPTWPEGASGVTIGIGFDCGYSSPTGIQASWEGRIPQGMIDTLKMFSHATGTRAQSLTHSSAAQSVIIPWAAALSEFEEVEVPDWIHKCAGVFPNFELLPPDCKGAIVSLGYNRGLSLSGDRRREMMNIKNAMEAKEFNKIPAEFRAMERLWIGTAARGLVNRREVEAKLFENGLKEMNKPVAVEPIVTATEPVLPSVAVTIPSEPLFIPPGAVAADVKTLPGASNLIFKPVPSAWEDIVSSFNSAAIKLHLEA